MQLTFSYSLRSVVFLTTLMFFGLESPALSAEPDPTHYTFNRTPLSANPFAELPLGSIRARGWLKSQLECMAGGMSGNLDELYPEVVGPRNGWLGGDGDGWERGPYWIDGLLPLAHILGNERLIAKVKPWVEWTLTHQAEDGYLGPVPFDSPPEAEPGLQRDKRRDWWPKMVMLKILQQHYMATGDERVVDVLTKYFRYQLKELPKTPLNHWTFWGNRRGADNLMVVYWLYNITGDEFLLELGQLIHEQTHPYTKIFLHRGDIRMHGPFNEAQWTAKDSTAYPFHCVNLAQGMKAPIIYSQFDPDPKYLQSVKKAFRDLEEHHGQPHGLFGGDEALHGRQLTRGTELCTVIEMMFSLEKMLEITGDTEFADRLEQITFNLLTAQISDDCRSRQYFQLANQVMVTHGKRNFYNNEPDRMVFGLLAGYPCCTCNLHQGWPKFTQHLWMAARGNGLAALVYAPSAVTAKVGDAGEEVTITERTDYPFRDVVSFEIESQREVAFPLQLRIPGWCDSAELRVNDQLQPTAAAGKLVTVDRTWKSGDKVTLKLPMTLKAKRWHENSVGLTRGPLAYALRIEESWHAKTDAETQSVWAPGDDQEIQEVLPTSPWNYALPEKALENLEANFKIVEQSDVASRPWSLNTAPTTITTQAVRLPDWKTYNDMAGPVPWSPQERPPESELETITLVPFGCTTLRISGFPTVN